jgi:thioredoxin reductase
MNRFDVVIIGGGAAGISAALVLSRARREVLVVDAGEPRNAPATHMHGYLSRDGISPAELLATGRREVEEYGGEIVAGTVTDLVPDGRTGFWVLLADGQRISARRLLVTTGLHDELPDVPGLRDRWARDVLHCPYCHGHEVRDHQLGVIGGTPGAVRYAQIVRQWTHDLVYFTPPDILTAGERAQLLARAIGVVEGTIDQLVIDDADHLCGVQMHDGCVIPRDALFVPPHFVPNSPLLVDLGCQLDTDGWVSVDNTGRTSVTAVWAAGNVVDPRAQVITAAGAGSAAAIAMNADLVEDDVRNAVRDLDHGFPPPSPGRSIRRSRHDHHTRQRHPDPELPPRAGAADQKPTGPDDLAGGLSDPHRSQPRPR